mmetsp:Transcript_41817/g.100366  ORF Transcript_41817/g.100366 Transcript_41817/m.100366 type:complete len:466 (+) Transcript_41817:802-2199(+)
MRNSLSPPASISASPRVISSSMALNIFLLICSLAFMFLMILQHELELCSSLTSPLLATPENIQNVECGRFAMHENPSSCFEMHMNNKGNSSTATVISMATGYKLGEYQRFVGSLRKAGYSGHIILAVSPTISNDAKMYLHSQGVQMYEVQKINCTFSIIDESKIKNQNDKEIQTCLHPYPTLKNRWARYPLLRDFLQKCSTCTGPVLHTDMRDAFFQRDPFGPDAPPVHGLQVFEEHFTMRTTHWVSDWPVNSCKGIHIDEPMLCSGTTVGTRRSMLEYFNVMHEEMNQWMSSPRCCCLPTNADDQSIHNWLFYGTDLLRQRGKEDIIPNTSYPLTLQQRQRQQQIRAVAIPNREGIVNTVGAPAAMIRRHHKHIKDKYMYGHKDTYGMAYDGQGVGFHKLDVAPNAWLPVAYGLTDEEGYFVQTDGSRSFLIHQFDRFGQQITKWLTDNRYKMYLEEDYPIVEV